MKKFLIIFMLFACANYIYSMDPDLDSQAGDIEQGYAARMYRRIEDVRKQVIREFHTMNMGDKRIAVDSDAVRNHVMDIITQNHYLAHIDEAHNEPFIKKTVDKVYKHFEPQARWVGTVRIGCFVALSLYVGYMTGMLK